MHIMDAYPIASASQIKKLIGVPVGAVPEKKIAQKKVNYPQNLLTALKADIKNPSEDQILGLAFAIGQLKEAEQEVLSLHYEKGLTYNEVGIQTGRSGSRCGSIARRRGRRTSPRRAKILGRGIEYINSFLYNSKCRRDVS